MKASIGNTDADRVDDDKYAIHTEIGNNKTEYQVNSNDYATGVNKRFWKLTISSYYLRETGNKTNTITHIIHCDEMAFE